MADERLRRLQRGGAGDVEAAARLLAEQVRAGQASAEQVAIAAWAGDPAARLAHGAEPPAGVELVRTAWARLEQWFAAHAPKILGNLRPGATPAAIATLERKLGRELPAELRASLERHDGQREDHDLSAFEEYWNLRSTEGIFEDWDMLEGIFRARSRSS